MLQECNRGGTSGCTPVSPWDHAVGRHEAMVRAGMPLSPILSAFQERVGILYSWSGFSFFCCSLNFKARRVNQDSGDFLDLSVCDSGSGTRQMSFLSSSTLQMPIWLASGVPN